MRNFHFSLSLFFLYLTIAGYAYAKQDNKVLLRWKIPTGKTVAFDTSMEPLDPKTDKPLIFDLQSMSEGKALSPEAERGLQDLKFPKESSVTSLLTGLSNGNIGVRMIFKKMTSGSEIDPQKDKDIIDMLKKMENTVQLRGEISPSGETASFFLEGRQKNLLAQFFELPKEPVSIGDSWSIGVNLLAIGPGFIADKASRTNRVKLISLSKNRDGDTVATLDYGISESVSGKVKIPSLDKTDPMSMAMGFVARAEFLVEKGTWRSFNGRIHIKASGENPIDSQQSFSLKPLDYVPKKMLDTQ